MHYASLAGGSASYSCENALVFLKSHMKAFLDEARESTKLPSKDDKTAALAEFFALRKGAAPDKIEDLHQFAVVNASYFSELQPFELLQTPRRLQRAARVGRGAPCAAAARGRERALLLQRHERGLVVEE